jgi:hypothetical protein
MMWGTTAERADGKHGDRTPKVEIWGRRFESCLPDSQPVAVQCSHFHAIAADPNLSGISHSAED